MEYTDVRNPVYSSIDNLTIDCEVKFKHIEEYIPFTSKENDLEHSSRIFKECVSGKYGKIREFIFDFIYFNATKRDLILNEIQNKISSWQTELALNIIDDKDRKSLINWLKYAKDIKSIDINQKEIKWPKSPE